MKAIIVGGGKVGYYLLKTLKERGFDITLIERDKEICGKISEDIGAEIICGDGTDLDTLREAGIEEADVVAAVTGKDEGNLIICQTAKIAFGIQKTISRISNPKNIKMFKALGVDRTVCSTEVIANLIQYEFDTDNYKVIQTFERGAMLLVEVAIEEYHPWANCLVQNLKLPKECVFASVLREDKVIYPKGDTMIQPGDKILIITNKPTLAELKKNLNNRSMQNEKHKK